MYIAKHFLNEKSILYFYFGERIARVMASKQPYSFSFVKILKISSHVFDDFYPQHNFCHQDLKMGQRRLVQGFKARPAAQRSTVRYPPSEYFQSIYILENEFKDFCQKPTTAASR